MHALTALLALQVAAVVGAGSQREAAPDCPRGPTHPCREPAAPVLASGFAASNLFWPGETDAHNVTYACTYRPMITLVNATRLLAIGACVPAECEERKGFCNGLHLLGASTKGDCWAGCMKHSDNSGRSWSRIERVIPSDTDFWVGMLLRERRTGDLLLQRVMPSFKPNPGAVVQTRSTSRGATWGAPTDISAMLGPLFSPGSGKGLIDRQMLNVGPSTQGLQLSATNPYHPHRILFAGHHGAYEYDVVWYSDDGGATYTLARNASDPRKPAQLWNQDEIALAETPDGGVIASTRNEDFHSGYAGHKSACNCRGLARSGDGGTSFGESVPDPVLVGPVCQATMLTVPSRGPGHTLAIFHANPSHGTPKESKSPPDGRASGVVRRSVNGGRSWEASVVLNGREAYAYSCLTEVPQPGFIGLAFETVLPGSDISPKASANNIVFVLIPQNFTSQ